MIVEVSQFRLVPGTDEDAFLAAAEETQTGFLATQPGFVGRELLRGSDGSWLDIVRFVSADAAHAAFAAFVGHPSTGAFEAMLDPEAVSMTHWAVARSW